MSRSCFRGGCGAMVLVINYYLFITCSIIICDFKETNIRKTKISWCTYFYTHSESFGLKKLILFIN